MDILTAQRLKPGQIILSKVWKNADGSPQRFRVNGVPKLWKRTPSDVRVPLKRGLYEYGYLTQNNMGDFMLEEQER